MSKHSWPGFETEYKNPDGEVVTTLRMEFNPDIPFTSLVAGVALKFGDELGAEVVNSMAASGHQDAIDLIQELLADENNDDLEETEVEEGEAN